MTHDEAMSVKVGDELFYTELVGPDAKDSGKSVGKVMVIRVYHDRPYVFFEFAGQRRIDSQLLVRE
jgi:hypothetical protein